MDLGLKGRAALVGGASAGLGRATAERLASEGCKLALWSRGGDALEQAAEEIREIHSVVVVTIAGDATDPATPARVVTAPAGVILRMVALPVSATVTLPEESTATP